MTDHSHNGPDDPTGSGEGARKLDEDAAWRAIVENYGERASLDSRDEPPAPPAPEPAPEPAESRGVLEDGWREDSLQTPATWEDEGHFVPPPAPPVPPASPRRRLAWTGLFGTPAIMLIAVVLGISLPGWMLVVLSAGFVGGFVYLVATMPDRHGDWPGDNGAVV